MPITDIFNSLTFFFCLFNSLSLRNKNNIHVHWPISHAHFTCTSQKLEWKQHCWSYSVFTWNSNYLGSVVSELLFFLVHMANWFCCFLYSNFIKYTLQCQYAILIPILVCLEIYTSSIPDISSSMPICDFYMLFLHSQYVFATP
jgi:hypothetical protein